MFKQNFKDKMTLSGTIVLTLGVGLLIFTFFSAYGFLAQSLSILTSTDLAQTFGEALAPLIATSIRIMYLGVMGWIGSVLTIRGITILSQARQTPEVSPQQPTGKKEVAKEEAKVETKVVPKVKEEEKPAAETKKPEPEKTETKPEPKPESKPYEPEIIMLPPMPLPQTQEEQPAQQNQGEQK